MKIGGKALVTRHRITVILKRPDGDYPLVVTALPIGWESKMLQTGAFDRPVPPLTVPRKADGTVVVNPETKRADPVENRNDPDYVREVSLWYARQQAVRLRQHLSGDSSIEWDAVPPEGNTKSAWLAYADALVAEIAAAGLSEAEVEAIVGVGSRLENSINLREALESFLSTLPS